MEKNDRDKEWVKLLKNINMKMDYKNVKDKLPSLLNKLDRDMSGDDDNAR